MDVITTNSEKEQADSKINDRHPDFDTLKGFDAIGREGLSPESILPLSTFLPNLSLSRNEADTNTGADSVTTDGAAAPQDCTETTKVDTMGNATGEVDLVCPSEIILPAETISLEKLYEVKPGDSLWKIAAAELGLGVSEQPAKILALVDRIAEANNIANPNLIKIPMTLVIPQ